MNRIDRLHQSPTDAAPGSWRMWRALVPFLVLLGLASVAPLASAANCTWTGAGTDSNWSTPANWNGCNIAQPVPLDGDTLVFPLAAGNKTNLNDLVGLDLSQIVIAGASYLIRGNAITLTGGIVSSTAAGGSGDFDSEFGPAVTLVGGGQTVQCLGVRGLSLTGALDLGGFGLGFDGVCEIRVQGSTSGGGGLTKSGTGTLILSAANTYSGVTNINAGTLVIRDSQALGANGTQSLQNGVSTSNGATLQLDGSLVVTDEPLTLNGVGVGGGGALQTLSGSSIWTGPVVLSSNASVGTTAGTRLTISGAISDEASGSGVTKIGAGTLEFTGANTYRGTTTITSGILTVASTAALGATGAAGGTIVLDAAQLQIQSSVVIDESLTLNGNGIVGTGALRNVSGNNTWTGPITLATNTSIRNDTAASTLTLSGNAGGSGGLTKVGPGTLVLSGANTYAGATQVSEGILLGNSDGSFGTSGGPDAGTSVADGATLQLAGSIVVATESLTLNGIGIGGAGALRNVSGSNTWSGPILLASATTIDSGAVGHQLTLSGNTSGSGGLAKVGTGRLVLSGANTYTGTTQVNEGVLLGNSDGSFGAGSGPGGNTTVASGATLQLGGSIVVASESLSLSGAGIGGTGALLNVGGNNTWAGNINLDTNTSIGNEAVGTMLTLSGNTSGSGNLTKVGTGTLAFPNSNSYSGQTTIQQGVVVLNSGGALGTAAAGTTVLDGAQLQIQGSMTLNESLTLNGLGVGGTGAVHTSGNVYTVTFGGSLLLATDASIGTDAGGTLTIAGNTSGAGGLTKFGAGTLTLAGSNSHSGNTTINGGVLLLTGSVNAVAVNTGARLAGNGNAGTITLNDGGMISPTGTLSASSLLWNDGGVIEVGFGGAAGGSDRLQLAGPMQKSGDTRGLYRLFGDSDGDGSADPVPGVTYVLTTYASTTFVEADFSFDYVGTPGAALTGEFIRTPTQVEFVPTSVSLFRDSFEDQ